MNQARTSSKYQEHCFHVPSNTNQDDIQTNQQAGNGGEYIANHHQIAPHYFRALLLHDLFFSARIQPGEHTLRCVVQPLLIAHRRQQNVHSLV